MNWLVEGAYRLEKGLEGEQSVLNLLLAKLQPVIFIKDLVQLGICLFKSFQIRSAAILCSHGVSPLAGSELRALRVDSARLFQVHLGKAKAVEICYVGQSSQR